MNVFHGMKIYTVHVRPDNSDKEHLPIFVKEGFSFPAFVFTLFWALYKRLWLPALLIAAVNITLMALLKHHVLAHSGVMAIQLGFNFLIASHAHDWVRAKLRKQGYILTDITTGDSLLRAEQRYFERFVERMQTPALA